MEPNKDKIPSPFETPEGYFDNFEARLAERMAAPKSKSNNLTVTHHRKFRVEWIAAAAAIAAILVTAWFIFKPTFNKNEITTVKPIKKDTVVTKMETPIVQPDSAKKVETENAIIESIMEDAIDPAQTSAKPVVAVVSGDEQIAAELEEAGLIVINDENSLFYDIEINP